MPDRLRAQTTRSGPGTHRRAAVTIKPELELPEESSKVARREEVIASCNPSSYDVVPSGPVRTTPTPGWVRFTA